MGQPSGTLRMTKEDMKKWAVKAVVAGRSAIRAAEVDTTRVTDVPYCSECQAHVRWKRLGGILGVVLAAILYGVLGLLAGGLLFLFAWAGGLVEQNSTAAQVGIIGLSVAAGIALALAQLRWRPRAPLGRKHARDRESVEVARFNADEMVVRCHNDPFAAEVLAANPGSAYSRIA
jgi:hypothetical protein